MVYITNWQEFQEAAERLYETSPRNTRYCVKWRGAEGLLVLKITDSTTCLKYKTHSSIFLNRFETLNLSLMRKMQNRAPAPPPPPPPPAGTQGPAGAAGAPGAGVAAQTGSSAAPAAGGPSGGGVKKKKGRKKK